VRVNHEFQDVNKIMGFFAEIRNKYHRPNFYVAFNHVFAYLPLVIRFNDDVVYLHCCLGPQFVLLDQLKAPSPPIAASTDPIIESTVWSDPNADITDFQPNSKRNRGSEFSERPLADFLSCHGLKTLVRGHSLVPEGVRFALGNRVVTVSSASNYCEGPDRLCGVLVLPLQKMLLAVESRDCRPSESFQWSVWSKRNLACVLQTDPSRQKITRNSLLLHRINFDEQSQAAISG
jgi:diadenosine tetraphosphatase ApaH/serine/threonine PP2A family protein phosphatase